MSILENSRKLAARGQWVPSANNLVKRNRKESDQRNGGTNKIRSSVVLVASIYIVGLTH